MNFYKSIIFICAIIFSQTLKAQVLFVEDVEWGKEMEKPIPDSLDFKFEITTDDTQIGDTAMVKILYPNNKLAAEGKVLTRKDKFSKTGIWKFYYLSGELWSEREYIKSGKLMAIHKLVAKDGSDLDKGFGRHFGKRNYLTGYNYIYDEDSNKAAIGYYSSGGLIQQFAPNKYSDKQLQRLHIRTFKISDSEYLEELSFEEAFEQQKQNGKTILLNASTNWNGWTKRGYTTVFTKQKILEYLDEHFILAYLDIEDTKDVELEVDGEPMVLKGAANGRQHELIEKTVRRISATPTFIFLGPNLEVLHKNSGIEIKEEKFMNRLVHFTSGKYKTMSIEEFEKG